MLNVENLKITFTDRGQREEIVHGISFAMEEGETVGIVGESGSGKTQTALSIAGLMYRDGVELSGKILLDGRDILSMPEKELLSIRGKDISMIFQEPMTSLNPTMKIGRQVEESLRLHTAFPKSELRKWMLAALREAELPDPEQTAEKYPHELSGGQRQRVMIAAAMICRPRLLIADEPTTALDVTIQAQILKLLQTLSRENGMGILFISHDLRVIRRLCTRVLVMERGNIVETGTAEQLFEHPSHPYTQKLIASIPTRNRRLE